MDIGSLPLIIFSAFTAVLACGSVALLCQALKRNNEHVRAMIAELGRLKTATESQAMNPVAGDSGVRPSAPKSTRLHQPDRSMSPSMMQGLRADLEPFPAAQATVSAFYEEPSQVIDPAADGTPVYIHAKSGMASRSMAIRTDAATIPVHAAQPMYIDEGQQEQPFAGIVVVIGVTAPGSHLTQSLRQLVPHGGSERAIESIAPDEFLLTYAANRRNWISLHDLGVRLWEIQLHIPSASSDLLFWAAIEVNGQTLREAIELARERLYEEKKLRLMLASRSAIRTPVVIYTSLLGRLLALRKSNKVRSDEHPELVIMLAGPVNMITTA